jgi:hypothetical protein
MLGCVIFSVPVTSNLIGSFKFEPPRRTPLATPGCLTAPRLELVAAAYTEAVQCHWPGTVPDEHASE